MDLNSVFDPKKDELDELVISSCSRFESLSDLLSFISDSVVGRLNKSFQFWRGIFQAQDFVIVPISSGYKFLLLRYIPNVALPRTANQRWSIKSSSVSNKPSFTRWMHISGVITATLCLSLVGDYRPKKKL